MIHHWKALMLYFFLESAKIICNLDFFAKSSFIVKLFKKMKNAHFWQALDHIITFKQKFSNILNNLMCNKKKLKMWKFLLICNYFFAKLKQSVSLWHRLSKKLTILKNLTTVGQNKDLVCYRKKKSFSQCAWGLRQLV